MLELVIILLVIVGIVWLATRVRKNPLDDIAGLAAIEAAAPQGSMARKLLTEELAKKADAGKKREKRGGLWLLLGGFFLIIYLSAQISGTPTQQMSAPVEPAHASDGER